MTSSHSQIHGGLHPQDKPRPGQPGAGNQESPPPMEHPGTSHHYADTRAEIPRNFHTGREGTSRMRRLCSLFRKVARSSNKRPVAKSQIHSRSTCPEHSSVQAGYQMLAEGSQLSSSPISLHTSQPRPLEAGSDEEKMEFLGFPWLSSG